VTRAVALVSARAAHGLDEDMPPLIAAFAAAGAAAEIADWDDPGVEWRRFDLALLRSAWDYAERLPEFLTWVEQTAAATRLVNPAAVVRWNADKHYLLELERARVPVVASAFVEPGADAARALDEFLERQPSSSEFVVKPAVGAGSRDARRHARHALPAAHAHLAALLSARRSALLQPYLPGVERDGETALIYIGGRFSHAVRKGPLLAAGGPATAGLFAPEEISARAAEADELAVGARALAALPFATLSYARVDLIRAADGGPRLLELELTEPSLFFARAPGSAERLVESVLSPWAAR
jgi:glutathione synthase/RimK-type ligase-like ATP-grasp enzyme